MNVIYADVLVVGGGGAADRAAIEAHDGGAEVIMATKGRLGASGATAAALADVAGLAVADKALDPADAPEFHSRDILEAGLGMCDQKLVRILTEEAPQTIPDLEKWGVHFERDGAGKYLITKACFSSRARNYKLMGHGKKITDALTAQIRKRNIRVLEETMLVDVLCRDGAAGGAVLLQSDGTILLIAAAQVILATGGAGELFHFNMNPPDITGDGCAAGFRAGAQLFNTEFIQYGFGTLPRKSVFAFWLWAFHPLLTNGRGEEFLEKYLPDGIAADMAMDEHGEHFPFSNRLVSRCLEIAVHREIGEGRSSANGGVYADFRGKLHERGDLPDTARKLWRTTRDWYMSIGMPMDEKPVEMALYAHAMNGGLRVDENGETRVRGLFAAGECASGPHGADRLGGGMLTACQVFGKRAGRAAAARREKSEISPFMKTQYEEIERIVSDFRAAKNDTPVPLSGLRGKIQDFSAKYLMLDRNDSGLRTYLGHLDALEEELRKSAKVETNLDLFNALELRNLILVGRIMAEAAMARKETRGSHLRTDYPHMDGETRWILVDKSETGLPRANWTTPAE
ncbi:MAG: FAD-binding protein [Planctomycetota bacterium]|jgi:succinate dehydrogenase/fumarate reductase flavoprotein subunit|nr:FAD-binding protein [Planctomycetota bacterium]